MKKKVCVVGPALKMGGMERASANLANGLHDLGQNVSYVSFFKKEHFFKLRSGIVFHEPSDFNIDKLSLLTTIKWLRHTIKNLNPDSIIVFNKFYSAITLLALTGTHYHIFISERSSPLFQWGVKLDTINNVIFSFRKPIGILAQTKIAADYQRRYYGSNIPIKILPNPVREVQLFPEIERQKIVLAVGRFNDHLKGFDRLIKAFAKVNTGDWILVFAGGDEDGSELKKMTAEYNIIDKVRFLGKVKDIDRVYAEAGIFVIPSRSEGFPNALCEAMAAGLPCISFDFIAGPREIISDGIDGVIVPEGDVDALAKTIERMIEDPTRRKEMGEKALAIRNSLKEQNIIQDLLHFINDPTLV